MHKSPDPRPPVRLILDVNRTQDGRLEGRVVLDGTNIKRAFSGVLELLKVIEELVNQIGPAGSGSLSPMEESE
jgi:hypothetical protein